MQANTTTTAGTGADPVATDETDRLIASDKVEGTAVYNRQGERLGSVYNFMVDKRSGQVAYAVLSFGGFLGVGDKLFAIPWTAMRLDEERKCFVLDVDKSMLDNAPGFDKDNWPDLSSEEYARSIYSHYGQKHWS
jgi:sporulation protein YlmC with PRC-barrel domain